VLLLISHWHKHAHKRVHSMPVQTSFRAPPSANSASVSSCRNVSETFCARPIPSEASSALGIVRVSGTIKNRVSNRILWALACCPNSVQGGSEHLTSHRIVFIQSLHSCQMSTGRTCMRELKFTSLAPRPKLQAAHSRYVLHRIFRFLHGRQILPKDLCLQ
jgi:hypothetical protein